MAATSGSPRTSSRCRARSSPSRPSQRSSLEITVFRPDRSSPGAWATRRTRAAPSSSARRHSHDASRVFPTPAGPDRRTIRGRRSAWTARSSSHSASCSSVRPTIGGSRSPNRPRPAPTSTGGRRGTDSRQSGTRRGGPIVRPTRGTYGISVVSSSSVSSVPSVVWVSVSAVGTTTRPEPRGVWPPSSPRAARAAAASAARWGRSSGRFASSAPSHASRPGGTSIAGASGGGGRDRWARTRAIRLSPSNGSLPVTRRQARHPRLYRSVQGPSSGWSPISCSGAMYAGVPAPGSARSSSPKRAAIPKSVSLRPGRGSRSPQNSRFAGFRSRCTIPRACAWARASRIASSRRRTSDQVVGALSSRVPVLAYSMASHGLPSTSRPPLASAARASTTPTSRRVTMCGWSRLATARTSFWKPRTYLGFRAFVAVRTFSATGSR